MRVLIDYRAALSRPSGVGEYARQLASGLTTLDVDGHERVDVTLFSSSWKDRLTVPDELNGVRAIDQHIPVAVLNFAWHRLGWPPAETLTDGVFDVAHSLHPLLLPSRSAAQVVTVHDLNFLDHPERTRAEVRRDYRALAGSHAARADRVMVPSKFTAGEVERKLRVPASKISVCSPGAPAWTPRTAEPADGYILFLGTLEPRKNVGTLLDAYERLLAAAETGRVPNLVLAGGTTEASGPWLERIARAPLAGRVTHLGYVDPADRKSIYEGALMLVQPSYEEGFGLPPLEAMTLGVPVVGANRGAVPEVVGDAGLLVDPDDAEAMATAMRRFFDEPDLRAASAGAGPSRARLFTTKTMAERAREAYALAIEHRASMGPLT
ncbi:MAG TPA: glycosyltransferase family 1 protein [Vicinamibacterales bacterium]|jgi:glycosyltransferase involved in cell wall biosynthesis|nr:glycosyltransferase family 1 protein [Vicinamibacterales bacterium]